jgi:hypothetical protein
MTREEHLERAKKSALRYCAEGDWINAVSRFRSEQAPQNAKPSTIEQRSCACGERPYIERGGDERFYREIPVM